METTTIKHEYIVVRNKCGLVLKKRGFFGSKVIEYLYAEDVMEQLHSLFSRAIAPVVCHVREGVIYSARVGNYTIISIDLFTA